MDDNTGAEYLLKKLKEQRERIIGHILKGVSFEQEYYRYLGLIQGFDYAIELIRELEKQMANNEGVDFNE